MIHVGTGPTRLAFPTIVACRAGSGLFLPTAITEMSATSTGNVIASARFRDRGGASGATAPAFAFTEAGKARAVHFRTRLSRMGAVWSSRQLGASETIGSGTSTAIHGSGTLCQSEQPLASQSRTIDVALWVIPHMVSNRSVHELLKFFLVQVTNNVAPGNGLTTSHGETTQRKFHSTAIFSNEELPHTFEMVAVSTSLENGVTWICGAHTETSGILVIRAGHLRFCEQSHPVPERLLHQLLKLLRLITWQAFNQHTALLVINHKPTNAGVVPQSRVTAQLVDCASITASKIQFQSLEMIARIEILVQLASQMITTHWRSV